MLLFLPKLGLIIEIPVVHLEKNIKKLFIELLKFVYLIDNQSIKYYEQLHSKL